MAIDYKKKYLELKNEFLKSLDASYRLGMEEGLKQGAQQAQMQQMQQQQQMMQQQQQMMGGAQGQEQGQEMSPEEQAMMEQQQQEAGAAPAEEAPEAGAQAQPSELEDAIGELESLVAKNEKIKLNDLKKAADRVIALKKKTKIAEKRQANLAPFQQKTLSVQKKIVSDIMKKWEEESKSVTSDIENIILKEGLKID